MQREKCLALEMALIYFSTNKISTDKALVKEDC
jgi:hypothetical protein